MTTVADILLGIPAVAVEDRITRDPVDGRFRADLTIEELQYLRALVADTTDVDDELLDFDGRELYRALTDRVSRHGVITRLPHVDV